MGDENRAKKSSVPSSSPSDCDVVLGLKMQRTESLPEKRTMVMHHPSLFPPTTFGSAVYGTPHLVLPHHHPSSVNMPFTVNQWQELERQKMIYKYMMSSVPVPTELLLSPVISPDLPSSQIQSNTSGLELKFSRSSDPEPWRCRRTDGKKWRCSRDVTPDQKYCERHAHKNRPRSRKPVESHTHNSNSNSNSGSRGGSLSNTIPAPANVATPHPPSSSSSSNPIFQFSSSAVFGQSQKRSMTDWLSSPNYGQQQWQQFHEEGEVDHEDDHNDDERRFKDISQNWHDHDHQYLSYNISPGNSNQMMTTRHFIDAWPEKDHDNMVVLNGEDNENVNSQLGIGILNQSPWMMPSDHEQLQQPQQPGGPLGEALCSNNKNSSGAATSGGKSSGEDDGLGFRF